MSPDEYVDVDWDSTFAIFPELRSNGIGMELQVLILTRV
jgi:hypothetical protein